MTKLRIVRARSANVETKNHHQITIGGEVEVGAWLRGWGGVGTWAWVLPNAKPVQYENYAINTNYICSFLALVPPVFFPSLSLFFCSFFIDVSEHNNIR